MSKHVIYQVFPRLFGNEKSLNKPHGSIEENGCGKFNNFTKQALQSIKDLGVSHIWYTGVLEHATQTDYSTYGIRPDHAAVVKGRAGSPYAIKDYYDVDPDLAVDVASRMKEFEELVERTHQMGMGVIIDFVPNHVAREYHSDNKPDDVRDLGEEDNDEHSFDSQNDFYYIPGQRFQPHFDIDDYVEYPAKVTGNNQFTHTPTVYDWYETVKINYGVDYLYGEKTYFQPTPPSWYKMRDILLYWADKGVDAFRCDMAEMVPVEFWQWVIAEIKQSYPSIFFIAEVYNPSLYRRFIEQGGFDYLYDKVGLYDLLRNILCEQYPAAAITQAWQSIEGIADHMLHFLENHDEQRIASEFFAGDPFIARPAMIVSATLMRSPVMVYAGQELGEKGMDVEGFSGRDGRTTIFDYWGVKSLQQWSNKGKFNDALLSDEQRNLRSFYQRLLTLCLNEPAISQGKMFDLQYANLHHSEYNSMRQFSYFRQDNHELVLVAVNFSSNEASIGIYIPTEAFEYLDIEPGTHYKISDLMDESYSSQIKLQIGEMVQLQLPANNGRILKLQKV